MSGSASPRPETLTALFFSALRRHGNRPAAIRWKSDGRWVGISHDQLRDRVFHLAVGFGRLGLSAGDRVALLAENRLEWALTDYACLTTGLIDVPIYPSLPAHQIGYILRDAGARLACCSTAEQLAKLLSIRDSLPDLEQIIVFDDVPRPADVRHIGDVERDGAEAAADAAAWEQSTLAVLPDDVATLIYTSGTTGDPKGVMLSHGNIASNVVAALDVLDLYPGDCLSFLPLSHIFERMVGHYTMLHGGVIINYATSHETLTAEMPEVRPTIMASVPRMYEKIYARVAETAGRGRISGRIFRWAERVGGRVVDHRLSGSPLPLSLRLSYRVADRLVFRRIRQATGGRLRFCVSGGAPLNADISRFFLAAGMPCLEGYGLTETSPVITVNRLERIKPGTVGPPLPGVEVRIADDGEILTRGPHVMKGYFGNVEATREAIDSEGWFHTGDIGELDDDGYLKITDRKKDLIVTAGGKNIAPQPIESLLKGHQFFANAVMLGDKRRFPIMLLVPDFAALRRWAGTHGIGDSDPAVLVARPDVQDMLAREARKAFRNLAHYEMPKKFLVLPRDFSIESGELTPKLSIRRRVVEQHWRDAIDALYVEESPPPT